MGSAYGPHTHSVLAVIVSVSGDYVAIEKSRRKRFTFGHTRPSYSSTVLFYS